MDSSLKIPLNNLAGLKKALRNLQVVRPMTVLLCNEHGGLENAAIAKLSTFRVPHYVSSVIIPAYAAPAGKLVEVVIKLLANGPPDITIGNWPEDQMGSLLDALVDKRDLSALALPAHQPTPPFAKLAKKPQALSLTFNEETSDKDWTVVGDAIAASLRLTKLSLDGSIPETVFPSHLPVHLRDFNVYSGLALPLDWLSHDYWPAKLERLSLTGQHESLKFSKPTEIMKTRLRRLRSLTVRVESDCVDFVFDILSAENQIDNLSFGRTRSLDRLKQLIGSPFALMSTLTISLDLGEADARNVFEAIRAKTRATFWQVRYNGLRCICSSGDNWFGVMQTLLSVHELPRLSISALASLVPWRDHILRIVNTLGWSLEEYCVGAAEDYDYDEDEDDDEDDR